ncbi:hypothetical protein [Nocardioides sp. B-3]|uniref:hypothetical protein n=1 Tax=Nocardioides sp. B-3 TaxID=2895565 RepID=UPI00215254B3|nr:hypothetical protein [Nocardioides sp. B-3]UUZ61144.1 hypothetical protein LP418_11275 [Nocardioides sp. B-3]
MPTFAPEHFMTATAKDIGRYKQFRRGIEQLDREGVVQVLRSDLRGDQSPVLAAVGPMQFEVVQRTDVQRVQLADPAVRTGLQGRAAHRCRGCARVRGGRGVEVLQRSDGTYPAIFTDQWRAGATARDNPDVMLEPLAAG